MKSNFTIDLELISSLSITKSEAVVLDMMDYINNNPHFPAFKVSVISLSKMLQYSRRHLHRILKGLIDKELIYKDSNRYIVSDYYKEAKSLYFEKSHKKISKQKLTNKTLKECLEINTDISSKEMLSKQSYKVNTKSQKTKEILSDENNDDDGSISCQNVSKECQNVSLPIHYNIQNTITMFEKHSVDIAGGKKLSLEELITKLLKKANATSLKEFNIDKFSIPKDFVPQIREILSDIKAKSDEIKIPQIIRDLDSNLLNEIIEYSQYFYYLTLPKAKKEFIDNLENMIKNDSLRVNFRLCKDNGELVIANPSELDSSKMQVLKYVKEFLNLLLVRINVTKKGLIQRIKEVYKEKILEFITFRESKRRYFSSYSFDALCLKLAEFEANGIDVIKSINQSIERDYNWVFPPTHKKPRYYAYKRNYYPRRKYSEAIA